MSTRRAIYGYLFSAPFMIGFIIFFLSPFIFFVVLGFSRMTMAKGMQVDFVGIDNFFRLFTTNTKFMEIIFQNILAIFTQVPAIILYSFFIAIILNDNFRGRFLARAIFFLPVIIASGGLAILSTNHLSEQAHAIVTGANQMVHVGTNGLYSQIEHLFGQNALSTWLISGVDKIIDAIDDIVNASGVQILIFLAGLQTVPPSLYEASRIDGASSWENFWKITLPMLSPILLVNAAYTIIDCLAKPNNWAIKSIYDQATGQGDYTLSSAMGIVYFSIIFVVLGITMYLLSKLVYYED